MSRASNNKFKLTPLAFGAPILSGLALIPAFPRFEQGFLAWVALIPLLWFCIQAAPRQALLGGALFALPLHIYLNLYLWGVLVTHLSVSLALFTMALIVLIICAFYALFALAASCYARSKRFSFSLMIILPSLWLLMEYARSVGFTGYTVGYLGYTQWASPLILSLAAVYGYWGLPFIMVAFQSLVVLGFLRRLKGKALAAGAALLSSLFLIGILLPSAFPVEGRGKTMRVALIQGNSRPEEILSSAGREIILARHLEMTRQAAESDPQLQLVVWPETVTDLCLEDNKLHRAEMETLAGELNLDILFGARLRDGVNLYNAAVLLAPGKEEEQLYYKHLLVPVVEYFPLEEQLNELLNLDLKLGAYSAGEEYSIFDIRGVPLAAVICFESYFGSHTRHFSRRGAHHLFVLTNDVWFGETIGLEQHVQAAAIRAAEMGIGVTQVANSGITATFDYRGRELFRSGKSEAEIFMRPLELARRKTVYTLAGDYFPAIWLVFLIGATIRAAVKKRRRNYRLLKPFD